jgi:hypothetical protein
VNEPAARFVNPVLNRIQASADVWIARHPAWNIFLNVHDNRLGYRVTAATANTTMPFLPKGDRDRNGPFTCTVEITYEMGKALKRWSDEQINRFLWPIFDGMAEAEREVRTRYVACPDCTAQGKPHAWPEWIGEKVVAIKRCPRCNGLGGVDPLTLQPGARA